MNPSTNPHEPTVHESMLGSTSRALERIHIGQVHRAPWPDFDAFAVGEYTRDLRRAAAGQWVGRARAEHGSVHQFSALTHALCEARAPLHLLGALARLITDEVRHAELCAAMACALYPEGIASEPNLFSWPAPAPQWRDAPRASPESGATEAIELWAAKAVLSSCCIGEALSRPMLDAIATLTTNPICEVVARQILRDEQLHAAFGFETLGWLTQRLTEDARTSLQESLRSSLASFEDSTACGISIGEIANTTITIAPGSAVNLGTLTKHQYAMIFFSTLESEIFPRLETIGLDPIRAWTERRG